MRLGDRGLRSFGLGGRLRLLEEDLLCLDHTDNDHDYTIETTCHQQEIKDDSDNSV